MEIITNFLLQLAFTVGVIALFGLLIALCTRLFCNLVGPAGHKILLITGVVGTPIHELGHALMCLVFGHKIVEIKLYQPNNEEGTLGYVNHSYNPKNLYHQIGNFFIGVAPILCGSAVLFLLMALMVPNTYHAVIGEYGSASASNFLAFLWSIVCHVFDFSNANNVVWWIFIILALMVSSHMTLSFADIKGSLSGFLVIAVAFLLVDVILYIINLQTLVAFTNALTSFGLTVAGFLMISLVFNLFMIAIALLIRLIRKLIFRR